MGRGIRVSSEIGRAPQAWRWAGRWLQRSQEECWYQGLVTMGSHSAEGGREALRTGGIQAGAQGSQESLTKQRGWVTPLEGPSNAGILAHGISLASRTGAGGVIPSAGLWAVG